MLVGDLSHAFFLIIILVSWDREAYVIHILQEVSQIECHLVQADPGFQARKTGKRHRAGAPQVKLLDAPVDPVSHGD